MFFMSYIPCAIVLAVYLEEDEQPVQTSRVLNPQPLPHLFTELPPPYSGCQAWECAAPSCRKVACLP